MIRFENVEKIYEGNVKAVNNINLNIPEGEIVVLLGPSGCGKTTLLRMVNRLNSISSGTIYVNNQDINGLSKIELRRKIGYVIQSTGLFPNMTIEDNVVVVPDLLGWDKTKKRNRYNELMELIGMNPDEYRKRYPHELSGGQQQRIGIARALAADPPIMLMDEPFGALDPIIRSHLQNEFLRIQNEIKKTILFVSHDIDEAIKMADKVAILKDGQLMQYDTPAEILASPNSEFVAQFVGQDRALKRLSLYSVQDLLDCQPIKPVNTDIKESQQISLQNNLREALSTLLNQKTDKLIVIDNYKKTLGALTTEHIEEFLHREIKGEISKQGVSR